MTRKDFLILLVVSWAIPGFPGAWAQSPDEPASSADESYPAPMPHDAFGPGASLQDLQVAIEVLSDPQDHEQSSRVLDAIMGHTDEAARQALMEQFDRRMGELLAGAAADAGFMPDAPKPWVPGSGDGGLQSTEETTLRMELEELTLGPGASAEELRRRDALVARIAPLADPNLRYELLERLAQREQEADGGSR